MAFHAEGAGDGPAVLRYAPAAARRAAELGAHREAAAQYERALRFADGPAPPRPPACTTRSATRPRCWTAWQDAVDARERALALWRQEGDQLREGDTLRWLACALYAVSRGSEGRAAAVAAIALLEPLGTEPGAGLGVLQPRLAADGELPAC